MPSRPARGAWIEIVQPYTPGSHTLLSRPARGAWIEMLIPWSAIQNGRSRPARGAWIEIMIIISQTKEVVVAPLAGHVD